MPDKAPTHESDKSQEVEDQKLFAYWVSIKIPCGNASAFEYHGPWWVSGYDENDSQIICAAVMATDVGAAYETLRLAYDDQARPKAVIERFCAALEGAVFSDRFKRADWMLWPFPVVALQPRPREQSND